MALTIYKPIMPDDFPLKSQTEAKLHAVLDGTINFPGNGITGLLLYGIPGSGKTTMAELLPGWLETAKTSNYLLNNPVGHIVDLTQATFATHACAQGQNGASVMQNIQNTTSLVSFNTSNLHYVILDEVDLLTSSAIASLKAIMNQKNVVFILTTNNLNKISTPVQNRCHLLDMNAPPTSAWVTKIQGIYQQSNLAAPPASTISSIVAAGNGSARSILSDMEFAEALRQKKQGGMQ